MLHQPGAVVCLVGLVAGLVALGTGRLAGIRIELDVFNHFIPQIAVVIVACLLGLVVARGSLATAVAVTFIGLVGIGLWPHYVSRHGPPAIDAAEGERIVRVMAFNTRSESPEWRAVADEVLRQDPDIVALLEIARNKLPALEMLKAVYPHQAGCLDQDYCQIVVMSKFPIVSSDASSQWRGPPYVRVAYGPELGELTVVAAHTIRPPFFERQLEQMRVLGDLVAAAGESRIVLGDFNATQYSRMLQTFIERGELELASELATWPADIGLPQIAIDHILVSPGLNRLGASRIGSAAGSDHYPAIADIVVPLP